MLNDSILTLMTFLPAAGAVVVTLLPRSGRVLQWFTLLVTFATFGLALHLPAHYLYGHPVFNSKLIIRGSRVQEFTTTSVWMEFPSG